jgi:hypothetical protein
MRCVIWYALWKGAMSTGSIDFGVASESDPKVEEEKAKLEKSGRVILRVSFW